MTTMYSHDELMEILQNAHAGHTGDSGLHNFLISAATYCRQVRLMETIDRLVPSEKTLCPGTVVQMMLLWKSHSQKASGHT